MNTKARYVLILTLALLAGVALVVMRQAVLGDAYLAQGGAPTVIAYQGEVRVSGVPYTGDGHFKFAVVNAAGDATYWSNDGTSTGGGEPTAAVGLAVSDGLFSVLLGDTTLGGMTQPLTADAFSQSIRYLRVWFSSDNITFNRLTPDTRIAAVPYALQAQEAVDADTVDGLHASELGTHYQNVVVVAKSGGDYTGVQAAIDSITDAESNNHYLVWVAPGMYEEQVTMKPYVHLQGAGQEVTVIWSTASSSAWPPDAATLVLASDTSLRDLTVRNFGTGENNTALLATAGIMRTLVADVTAQALGSGTNNLANLLSGSGTGVTLQQMTALAKDGSSANFGLYNDGGAAVVLHGGSFTGRGGTRSRGIFNYQSGTTLEAESITALAEGASNGNFGLYNYGGAAATLHGGTFTGRGGDQTRGIENANSGATLTAENVTTLAENGSSDNYGLGNYDSAAATLSGGSFTARGGTNAYGVSNELNGATLEAEGVTALAENGSSANHGLWNVNNAQATVRGGSFTGRGGENTYGIHNAASGTTLDAESVIALAEDGSGNNYGLLNYDGAEAALRGGSFTGRGGMTTTFGIGNIFSATLEAAGVTALAENAGDTNHGLYNHGGAAAMLHGGSFTGRGGTSNWGINSGDPGTTLEATNVTALGKTENDSGYSCGLDTYNAATAVLHGGFFTARGGADALGIHNDGDTVLEAVGVAALGENGSNTNYGLDNHSGADGTLRGGSFTARGGATAYGIYNGVSGSTGVTLEADNVTALAENGSSNYGLYNDTDATAMADSSQFTGSSNGLYQNGGTVSLGVSQLDGSATRTSGTLTCFQVYDGSYAAYTCP